MLNGGVAVEKPFETVFDYMDTLLNRRPYTFLTEAGTAIRRIFEIIDNLTFGRNYYIYLIDQKNTR